MRLERIRKGWTDCSGEYLDDHELPSEAGRMAAVPALPEKANVIAHDVAATLRLRRRLTRHLAGRRRALNRRVASVFVARHGLAAFARAVVAMLLARPIGAAENESLTSGLL